MEHLTEVYCWLNDQRCSNTTPNTHFFAWGLFRFFTAYCVPVLFTCDVADIAPLQVWKICQKLSKCAIPRKSASVHTRLLQNLNFLHLWNQWCFAETDRSTGTDTVEAAKQGKQDRLTSVRSRSRHAVLTFSCVTKRALPFLSSFFANFVGIAARPLARPTCATCSHWRRDLSLMFTYEGWYAARFIVQAEKRKIASL